MNHIELHADHEAEIYEESTIVIHLPSGRRVWLTASRVVEIDFSEEEE